MIEFLNVIPFITGKAAIFGIFGLFMAQVLFNRPTVSITAAILAAGASIVF